MPAIKVPKRAATPTAPSTALAIEAAAAATSEATTAVNLSRRTVRFHTSIKDFVYREGAFLIKFNGNTYDATGADIDILRYAASRAWWLSEETDSVTLDATK